MWTQFSDTWEAEKAAPDFEEEKRYNPSAQDPG